MSEDNLWSWVSLPIFIWILEMEFLRIVFLKSTEDILDTPLGDNLPQEPPYSKEDNRK